MLVALADGGPLGCMFAAAHPERTVALVLCNTRPRVAWAPDYPWGMRRRSSSASPWTSTAAGDAGESRGECSTLGVRRPVLRGGGRLVPRQYEVGRRARRRGRCVSHVLRVRRSARARHIRVPTLVLSRGREQGDEGAAFARLIPGARHLAMPGTATYVIAEHADAYLEAIERFVRGVRDEEAELESILATVLFTDIVDSTARQAELGDVGCRSSWTSTTVSCAAASPGTAARSSTPRATGSLPRSTGRCARIRCAQAIEETVSSLDIELRAGLHTGECRSIDGKVGGLAVSIGARITSLAGPSEILVADGSRPRRRLGARVRDRGEHEFKGVPGRWKVYAVR